MIERLSSHWWLFLIRGILAILLALAALAFPGAALVSIAILFGAYAFVDGVVAIWTATRISHTDNRWGWLLFEGIVGILAGVFTFFYPIATVFALAFLLGAWAIISGILAIGSAFDARRHVPHEWLWVLSGIVSIIFGVAVFFVPAVGLFGLVYMLSFYALLAGIFFIGLAVKIRGLSGRTTSAA
ncbi:MAG TPA: DUF308 domain-containing protein [Candidatus Acidoferrum sp.]|nr:DUF308 domain-containing protein [Candidatus Acidoferrum sp.]